MNPQKFASVILRSISRSCGFRAKDVNLNLPPEVQVPVETDTERLANYVCGTNLFIDGEDVKLKPDSEYPEWLWKIQAPLPLDQLDPNSKTYWNRIQRIRERERKYLMKYMKHKTLQK